MVQGWDLNESLICTLLVHSVAHVSCVRYACHQHPAPSVSKVHVHMEVRPQSRRAGQPCPVLPCLPRPPPTPLALPQSGRRASPDPHRLIDRVRSFSAPVLC